MNKLSTLAAAFLLLASHSAVAAMGPFSADRTIGEYADKIWKCTPLELAS